MVKIALLACFFLLTLIKSCDEPQKGPAIATADLPGKQMVKRDSSINSKNAYNDLFLDSLELEKYIRQQKISDSVATAMRDFYCTRNYEYTWFSSQGLIEQSLSFSSSLLLQSEDDQLSRALESRLDKLRMEKMHTIIAGDPSTVKTELQITERFIRGARAHNGNMNAVSLANYIPCRKAAILERVEAVLTDSNYLKYAAINKPYNLVRVQLQQYSILQKRGGWKIIKGLLPKYSKGETGPVISLIKSRLQVTGELAGHDTTGLFDNSLEAAVKFYQDSRGYKPTGIVTASLLKDMNIPVLARLQQLIINMQRMRWMPTSAAGNLIIVNIPAFELYADSAGDTIFQMDVVVGGALHNTTLFSGKISQVVFSPYWNIPPSIVKKEVLPGLRRNKRYLQKRNMEITGSEGGLPVVRQRPGPNNALGKVKFLFPNSFNIYMHDTPQKDFFNQDDRGLSHGCIRLSNPKKMAAYLLRANLQWTSAAIDSAMNSGKEKYVRVTTPVPVIMTYFTAWVDKNAVLHFVDDIYGHDKEMARKMFTNPQ